MLSAPLNLAEGAAKRGPREFRRFLEAELAFQGGGSEDPDRQWQEFLSLLR